MRDDCSFHNAKRLYLEQYGDPMVTNTYLKIALVLVSLKPTVDPISVTVDDGFANNSLACSIRRLRWYRWGGMPNDCLKARQK